MDELDEIDQMEQEMHRVLDALSTDPALVEAMRQLWLQQLDQERRRRKMN